MKIDTHSLERMDDATLEKVKIYLENRVLTIKSILWHRYNRRCVTYLESFHGP